jgi:uncharacterized repeat protein (TIGR03803 family)
MKILILSRYLLWCSAAAFVLAGCGGSQLGTNVAPQAYSSADRSKVDLLPMSTPGKFPTGGLVNVGNVLYGTTLRGGAHQHGTLFSVTTGGTETTLHNFNGTNGSDPNGSLILVGSKLYGTTSLGGIHNVGTVFKSSLSGNITVLHSFSGAPDGDSPTPHLTKYGPVMYGTTLLGGSGSGTIFTITPSGNELVIHPFSGAEGSGPNGGLAVVNNLLYGTTLYGGGIYSATTAGAVTVLHTFTGPGVDGGNPGGDLVNIGSVLYGMTLENASIPCSEPDSCGSVYNMTTGGSFHTLYNFQGGTIDGFNPNRWGLTDVGGVLYGVTSEGGLHGRGVVFSVTTAGAETVLYSFGATATDASAPDGTLLDLGGVLYGTSYYGGTNNHGTVYQVTTSGVESVVYSF